MLRKPHLILLLVVVLAVLVLLALPGHVRSRVRLAFSSLFLPFFGLAGSAHAIAERVSAVGSRSTLSERVDALEVENQRLKLQLVEAEVAERENDQLRQMLGYTQRSTWRLKPARVVGRDPANWWRSVHIDVGSRQGITQDLAVVTPNGGLVGRVAEAGTWMSRVVLIGDPNCPVSVSLVGGGETGIIRGAAIGDIEGGWVDLSYLSRYATVKTGQRVITSGEGGVFPRGINVGEVVDLRTVGDGIYLEARVRLSVDLGALDLVWVKLP